MQGPQLDHEALATALRKGNKPTTPEEREKIQQELEAAWSPFSERFAQCQLDPELEYPPLQISLITAAFSTVELWELISATVSARLAFPVAAFPEGLNVVHPTAPYLVDWTALSSAFLVINEKQVSPTEKMKAIDSALMAIKPLFSALAGVGRNGCDLGSDKVLPALPGAYLTTIMSPAKAWADFAQSMLDARQTLQIIHLMTKHEVENECTISAAEHSVDRVKPATEPAVIEAELASA